jgi:hypothetical protein
MSDVKIKLKNRENVFVTIDRRTYDEIMSNEYLTKIRFLDNLRAHSNGYAVFQRCITTKQGPVFETIYLHKYIAEKFCKRPKTEDGKRLLVRFINEDVLDARTENLEWITMTLLRRMKTGTYSSTGYRGVIRERANRFKAVIYNERKPIVLGYFQTAEEAAEAYDRKSIELFGETPSLNRVGKKK